MASIQRPGTAHLTSPDASFYNTGGSHRNFNANLDKSHSFRDSHEGRHGAGSIPQGAGSSSNGELPPLSVVLSLDPISFDNKPGRHIELRRAINAACGSQVEDPSLGNIQAKPLGSLGIEDLKRVRLSLSDNASKARTRINNLTEAVIKLDRYTGSLITKKRSRPETSAPERSPAHGSAQRPAGVAHVAKTNSSAISSSLDTPTSQKGGDKSKGGIINKRVRTSLADVRPDGRPSLSMQRSFNVQDRERDSSKPSSSLTSPAEDKERVPLASSEGWEKTKMKGRRSASIKAETHVVSVANGSTDGEREHKGNAQHQRPNVESRSRPSEGHGYRSGPVNGVTSIQKADSSYQANGSTGRGSKLESDPAIYTGDKGDRPTFVERERPISKNVVKLSPREEAHTSSPSVTAKAKGARAPRSNLVTGASQSVHLSRSSSFTDVRDKPSVQAQPKPQVPSGATNRKRPASSRSSSPPVASWGSSRPQKMARVARRVNLVSPLSIPTPPKEETNGIPEVGTPGQAGSGPVSTPVARSAPPAVAAGTNVPTRVTAPSTHTLSQNRSRNERPSMSLGPLESEDSGDDGHKLKEKVKKHEGDLLEQKVISSTQKMGSVVLTAKKARIVAKEESGGGDGVRRQGRTGRGSAALRMPAVTSPSEKLDVSPLNPKLTRSARATVETKPVGRPVTKKGTADRKTSARPRRLLGNGPGDLSGEEDDDHEQLKTAVRLAMEHSAAACPNNFWRQLEPYFAYVTPDDLTFLHEQMDLSRGFHTSLPSKLDGANKSLNLANGVIEIDGALALEDFNNSKTDENGQVLRSGVGRGSRDKMFSLSQRLLSALINEGPEDDRLMASEEALLDQNSNPSLPPRSHMELDFDRRDPEGESDCDNVKSELDPWRSGKREGLLSEGCPLINGHPARLWGDDEGADGILVDPKGEHSGRQDCVSGSEMYSTEEQNDLSDWEEHYQRMSLDDRILLELQSIGLLTEQMPEQLQLEDDEISEELRRLEDQLSEQVTINKEHICYLENAVKKETESRVRERLAMDRLVEIAYKKRAGGRIAKNARAAALLFSKRVLARVRNFDAGQSCITDPALRDLLFCVASKVLEPACGALVDGDKKAASSAAVADRTIINSSPPSKLTVAAAFEGSSSAYQTEGKITSEQEFLGERPPSVDFSRSRDENWPLRPKERELLLEDVAGPTLTRGLNTLSINGLGGVKGKRSERDREGKAAHFKDTHARVEVAKDGNSTGRSGLSNVKGERKTKTKPRQKTAPLLKAVKGLVPVHSDQQVFKDRFSSQTHVSIMAHTGMPEPVMDPASQEPQNDSEGHIDLSALPLPGMEDLSVTDMGPQQDLNSWLDFDVEDPLQQTDEFLMGLDVPMDDLSELGMMM